MSILNNINMLYTPFVYIKFIGDTDWNALINDLLEGKKRKFDHATVVQ
jgi:hypothetical protein